MNKLPGDERWDIVSLTLFIFIVIMVLIPVLTWLVDWLWP